MVALLSNWLLISTFATLILSWINIFHDIERVFRLYLTSYTPLLIAATYAVSAQHASWNIVLAFVIVSIVLTAITAYLWVSTLTKHLTRH